MLPRTSTGTQGAPSPLVPSPSPPLPPPALPVSSASAGAFPALSVLAPLVQESIPGALEEPLLIGGQAFLGCLLGRWLPASLSRLQVMRPASPPPRPGAESAHMKQSGSWPPEP